MILISKALTIAQPKPWISKPLTVAEVIHSITPLITKVKSPSVTIFRGKVKIINNGRITAFTIPRNMDPTIAPQSVSSKFSNKAAVITIARIFKNHLSTQPCKQAPSFLALSIGRNCGAVSTHNNLFLKSYGIFLLIPTAFFSTSTYFPGNIPISGVFNKQTGERRRIGRSSEQQNQVLNFY